MIKLYWCQRTRASRAVWMLEEVGVDYERVVVDIRDKETQHPDFLAASPMGKVPAIEDGEVRMAESAAIALYLADRYSSGDLAPQTDSPQRGRFLYWMFYSPAVIEPAMAEKIQGAEPNHLSHGWGDWPSMIRTLEKGLEPGPWIMGERFSMADVMLGSSVIFMKVFNMLPESAILEAYAERCLARPGQQKAMALDA
jgi:glutathione S-transferase